MVELTNQEIAVLKLVRDGRKVTRAEAGAALVEADAWNGSDAPIAVAEGGGHVLRQLLRKGLVANVEKGMWKKPGAWQITDAGRERASQFLTLAHVA